MGGPGKLKIGDWETRRYDVEMTNPVGMKIETTMWTSNEIGVDVATLTKMSRAMTSLQPGTFDWVKKMEAIEGYPVLQESTVTMMGKPLKTSERLVAVEKQEAPAGHYDPPAGYKEKPFDPMRPIGRP